MKRSHKTYIIAEAGVNHNGSIKFAKTLIERAAWAGANAIKFQTFRAESVVSVDAEKASYQKRTTPESLSQLDMLKALELDDSAHEIIIEHSKKCGIEFISTPFDIDSINLLTRKFRLKRLKISSGDITNAPLLLMAARTGRQLFLSTGMSTIEEVRTALSILSFGFLKKKSQPSEKAFQKAYQSRKGQKLLQKKVALLHCTTEYPAPIDSVNLNALNTLRSTFGLCVGYSDHTEGVTISLAAAAMGASILEKHFTLDRSMEGPDHKASIEPEELKDLIDQIRVVEGAMGDGVKAPARVELNNRFIVRRGLVASQKIKKFQRFSQQNLIAKRPAKGLPPIKLWQLLGKRAKKDYEIDEAVM
jgi:N-acetylneuraminate synthase